MFKINDIGIEATEEQVSNDKVAAPAFPLPVVMLAFLLIGYFMLRQVWKP